MVLSIVETSLAHMMMSFCDLSLALNAVRGTS